MRRVLPLLVLLIPITFAVIAVDRPGRERPATFHVEPAATQTSADSVTITWNTPEAVFCSVEFGPTIQLGSIQEESSAAQKHQLQLDGLAAGTTYYYRVRHGNSVSRTLSFQTAASVSGFRVEPYLQLPATDAMTIMWETDESSIGVVDYGPTPELGMTAHEVKPNRLHRVRLTGLSPGGTYHYRARSGAALSAVKRFRTAPPPGTGKWKMAVYGDSRSNPATHRKVVEQIAKANVDLIVHTGDIVANGKNYASWRTEFFTPLAPIAGSVPWVSTIGNHEADSANYWSYMELPANDLDPKANERYFGFDFANAHIVCLDSNGWIEKGRDSKQFQWMERHFKAPRPATWTFVAFHHPLFSAHKSRPINPLRWDWAPLFVDPACRIDGVLAGHDHFYARNYHMGRVSDGPTHGTLFMTTAGGAAPLYPIKKRDYIAKTESVHHFSLFEFDGDQITLSAIDITGRVLDKTVLTKDATPSDAFCSYEVEELKDFLRKALVGAPTLPVSGDKPTVLSSVLELPTRFQVPIKGVLKWGDCPGWKMKENETPFVLQPRDPLSIPLQAKVEPSGLGATPLLTIEFEPGRFQNRAIEVYPFKLTGPVTLPIARVSSIIPEGRTDDAGWQKIPSYPLVSVTAGSKPVAPSQVQFASDGKWLYVGARLTDAVKKVKVGPPKDIKAGSKLVLLGEHWRVEIRDGDRTHVFAYAAEGFPYYTVGGKERAIAWPAAAAGGQGFWTAEMAIPLSLFSNRDKLRINVAHRSYDGSREFELRPGYQRRKNENPDLLPDWEAATTADQFAGLKWE